MRKELYDALKKSLVEDQDKIEQDGIIKNGDLVLICGEVYMFSCSKGRNRGFVALIDGNRWSDFIEYTPNIGGHAIKEISGSDVTKL